MTLRVEKRRPGAALPRRATTGSAGFDLCARLDAPLTLEPGQRALVPTGIAIGLPAGTVGLVCARSGLAVRHGLTLSNGVGVIDSDYTGEVMVGLVHLGAEPYTVADGERIAQLLVIPALTAEIEETVALTATARGAGGFGSTGFAPLPDKTE